MKLKTFEFLSLVLGALVMGVFWGTWFTLTRSIHDFSSAEFIHIGTTIISNIAVPMRILMPSTLVVMFLACWFSWSVNRNTFYMYTGAFILMLIASIITVAIEVHIDNQIK